jgi:hypothetical protein
VIVIQWNSRGMRMMHSNQVQEVLLTMHSLYLT